MKKFLFLLLTITSFTSLTAQIAKPVKWKSHIEKISDTEFKLVFEAAIEDGWHMYSQFTPDDGPLPIVITFKDAPKNYLLEGKAVESTTKREHNDTFGVDEIFFESKATLTQKVKVINPKLTTIAADVDYQACKDKCVNDNEKFHFAIPKIPVIAVAAVTAAPASAPVAADTAKTPDAAKAVPLKEVNKPQATNTYIPKKEARRGLWSIFFLAFLSGFAALLTPCVFPLIPMTVSFFTKQSKNKAAGIRNAITYGICIIAVYVILGFLVSWIFGAGALNSLSTNVWFNLVFFVLLVIFAVSFLGAFEIVLPHTWATKVDRQADRGGITGILFMALALAIVSFSCTGPIVGTLLVEAASHGIVGPILGMFGFSLALALPFMLFAMFPGWLNTLPKSGGWLNTVKVFLGFLELALAFKFLSNADLVLQLHFLEREVFIAIWIAIFATLSLYLFGKITTPHDSPLPFISVGRLLLGLLTLTFTIYLVPGLWGAPLKLISAFPPSQEYSESPQGLGGGGGQTTADLPTGAIMAHGLVTFEDYDTGLAYAKKVNKPVMLDFTGRACVNCRKMENNVWTDAEVSKLMKNDLVLISLFVDDKRPLPKEKQFISPSSKEEIVTIGDKWTDFVIARYKTNTQPMCVLVDTNGKDISPQISYVGTAEYLAWLKSGLANFK
jgi:thiol:disulfide interchange protein DsbD